MHVRGSPFAMQVTSAITCAAKSEAFGPGLSCATAGAIAVFTMMTRDAYSNTRAVGGDIVVAHIYPKLTTSFASHAVITDVADSSYHAMFTPVVSGEVLSIACDLRRLKCALQVQEVSVLKC